MSFGFGIGDFLAVLKLAKDIRRRFHDAPTQYKAISDDLKRLSKVLQDIEEVELEQGLSDQKKKELNEIAQDSQDALRDLESMLNKFQELAPDDSPDFIKRPRQIWKRLKWDQIEVTVLRQRIATHIDLFGLFLSRLTSQVSFAVKEGVDQLNRHRDFEQRQEILDWLTCINFAAKQRDFLGRREEGTGRWLLNTEPFQQWVSKTKQILFCHGIPGAGKTILVSTIISYLEKRFNDDNDVGISYIYCDFKQKDEQTLSNLLTSLLRQLAETGKASSFDLVRNLWTNILKSVAGEYKKTFVIIDALDEFPVSGGRYRFLNELFDLQENAGLNLLVTSRPILEIERQFEGKSIFLEIRAQDEDLEKYLDNQMFKLPSFVWNSVELQREVKGAIIKAVDGMFLLAHLYAESLVGKRSPKSLRATLNKFPSAGTDVYYRAYEEAMQRIEGQVQESKELAKQVLYWIASAIRPLTTTELQIALAVEIDTRELDLENLPQIEDMVSVCAGLVTVDKDSHTIRLVHYTTQTYFEQTWSTWFPDAQRIIVLTLVTYLSYEVFHTGFCPTDKAYEKRLDENPLYSYAAHNWGRHARGTPVENDPLVMNFLEDEEKVASTGQVIFHARNYASVKAFYSQDAPTKVAGVHLAASFGLIETIAKLLEAGCDPNTDDGEGRTPILYAVQGAHNPVVKLLLEKGVDPHACHEGGSSLLSLAAKTGDDASVRLFLEKGVCINHRSHANHTALLYAAEAGHETTVKLLIANSAEKDCHNRWLGTPLSQAALKGHDDVVRLLLEEGMHPDFKVGERTPLSRAAESGNLSVAKILVEKGANPNTADSDGQTPLWWAAKCGHEAVVQMLLDLGCPPDVRGQFGHTPLWWAARNGHKTMVQLLLEQAVDLESKSEVDGRTPLSWAAGEGHIDVVKLLLANKAEPNSRSKGGQTPLSWAAQEQREAVVKLLLESGSDPNSKATHFFAGRTPLSFAVSTRDEKVVKLLLEAHADPLSEDAGNQTPLSIAKSLKCDNLVQLLESHCEISSILSAT